MFTKISVATKIVIFATVLLGCFMIINAQSPKVSTAPALDFTYQGKLNIGTVAANGTYDFKFDIYDAETSGGIVQTITVTGVTVTNGIFTVKLAVNPATFSGDERFLEIWATNTGTFTLPMTPRQKVTYSPYAVRAKDADNAGSAASALNANSLGGIAANNYVQTNDARLTDARTPTAGSNDYVQNGTTTQTGNFNVNGTGKAGIIDVDTEYRIGGSRVITSLLNNNLFVGKNTGPVSLIGTDNSFFGNASGVSTISGSANAFFGTNSGAANTTGSSNTAIGFQTNFGSNNLNNATAIGAGAVAVSNNTVQLGRNTFDIVKIGKLDTTTGTTSVCLNANNAFANCSTSGNTSFIQNGTTSQTGNFNVSGTGKAGIVDASTEYRIGGSKVMTSNSANSNLFVGFNSGLNSSTGEQNSFFGTSAGIANTSGNGNSFFGFNSGLQSSNLGNSFFGAFSGQTNTSGFLNTAIGGDADFSVGNLTHATVIGSGATVNSSNTIQLGRNGTDIVKIGKLDTAGATSVCLNTSNALATCSSSIRYKQNIQDFRPGLNLIRKLRPVTFNWKADNKEDFGLVAEEVNAAEPLLTTTNKDGEVEGVKYDRVGVVLVNAVNEQQDRIEAQQMQINEQKLLIEKQQKELDALKKLICAGNEKAEVCRPKEQK